MAAAAEPPAKKTRKVWAKVLQWMVA